MAKCPWSILLGDHQVPELADGDLDLGDTGSCSHCMGRYKVAGVKPYKLAKRGKKPA